jgi:hypothetical protein
MKSDPRFLVLHLAHSSNAWCLRSRPNSSNGIRTTRDTFILLCLTSHEEEEEEEEDDPRIGGCERRKTPRWAAGGFDSPRPSHGPSHDTTPQQPHTRVACSATCDFCTIDLLLLTTKAARRVSKPWNRQSTFDDKSTVAGFFFEKSTVVGFFFLSQQLSRKK